MKTLKELRTNILDRVSIVSFGLKYLLSKEIDYDIYLPSIGKNLQRDFVWNIDQQRELIWSILIGRNIPHLSILNIFNPSDEKDEIYQIIDGKQRLTTMSRFYNNEFSLLIDGKEYFMNDLPDDYQLAIRTYNFHCYVRYEEWGKPVSDKEKIEWFAWINFAGTPQDKDHLKNLGIG